jgi:hypothetical protein
MGFQLCFVTPEMDTLAVDLDSGPPFIVALVEVCAAPPAPTVTV